MDFNPKYFTNIIFSEYIKFIVLKEIAPAFECFTPGSQNTQYPWLAEEMSSFIHLSKDKNCLLDIGACFGVFSLTFASQNNKSAYSVEPSPVPFEIFKYFIHINGLLNSIKPFKAAMGHSNGTILMKYDWLHLVAADKNDPPSQCIQTDVWSMDTFVANQAIIPDIIKLDTEGYEFFILQGGEGFLRQYSPIIHLETHSKLFNRMGISNEQFIDLVYSFNYKIFDLKNNIINNPVNLLSRDFNARIICRK